MLCPGPYATRSARAAPSRFPFCSTPNFTADESPAQKKRLPPATRPRTTMESRSHATSRRWPSATHALTAAGGRSARAARTGPSAALCAPPRADATMSNSATAERSTRIAGPLQQFDLLPVRGCEQLPKGGVVRIVRDRGFELDDRRVYRPQVSLEQLCCFRAHDGALHLEPSQQRSRFFLIRMRRVGRGDQRQGRATTLLVAGRHGRARA